MQRCVITRNFSHVPVTLLRTECLYGAIRRSILSLYYILLTGHERGFGNELKCDHVLDVTGNRAHNYYTTKPKTLKTFA